MNMLKAARFGLPLCPTAPVKFIIRMGIELDQKLDIIRYSIEWHLRNDG